MLIFHENNENVEKIQCADNVKKINLKEGGLATLITNAIVSRNLTAENKAISQSILHYMKIVLSEFPYILAQYKIGVISYIRSFHFLNNS